MSELLAEHYGYLSDDVKLRRYKEAIAAVIRPGQVVVDLGCGSGVLGLACLRAGAGRVHFIDESPFIDVARRTVAAAGYDTQATFHHARAQQVELPEKADVVICDHVGHFGIDYGLIEILADAQRRFLTPGGVVIPSELRLEVAAVESEGCRSLIAGWRDGRVPADYHWVGDVAADSKHSARLSNGDLLTDHAHLASLQPGTEALPFFSWTAEVTAMRKGTIDGVAGWFNCRLAGDVWMTNSPTATDRLKRAQAFFPIGQEVVVNGGTRVRISVMARPADHLYAWTIELPDSGQRASQSTWNGLLIDRADVVRANPQRTARLNQRGRARQIVLSYCDGVRTVAEVEQLVLRDHPDLFASQAESARFVAQVLGADTGS